MHSLKLHLFHSQLRILLALENPLALNAKLFAVKLRPIILQITPARNVFPTGEAPQWHGTRTASLSNKQFRVVFALAAPFPWKA
jgi:hypothetical protein